MSNAPDVKKHKHSCLGNVEHGGEERLTAHHGRRCQTLRLGSQDKYRYVSGINNMYNIIVEDGYGNLCRVKLSVSWLLHR